MTDRKAAPPTPCPEGMQPHIDRLEVIPKNILIQNRVPWYVSAKLSELGYVTLTDLGGSYRDQEDARTNAAKELGLLENDEEATVHKLAMIRLGQAVCDAKNIIKRNNDFVYLSHGNPAELITNGTREALEKAYMHANAGSMPPLKYQGSDHYLGMQLKECQRGSIGFFTEKQIVGKIPGLSEVKTDKKEQRKPDGSYAYVDQESREPPATWAQWREMTQIFRTSLLMCTAGASQHSHLQIDKETLDDFYNFVEGPDVGQNPQKPLSLARLRWAERECWKRISIKMHERVTLVAAIQAIKVDFFFWTHVLHGKDPETQTSPRQQEPRGGKGKWGTGNRPSGKGAQSAQPPRSVPWQSKRQPEPASKPQKTHTKQGTQQGKWEPRNSAGVQYCWNYNKGSCTSGTCNRVHRCCVKLGSGYTCNGKHPAKDCTRR